MVKRIFDKPLYWVVDYYIEDDGRKIFYAGPMEILSVNYEKESLYLAYWDDCLGNFYSFDDYNCLIFESRDKATKVAKHLPKPGKILYQVKDKEIFKRVVKDIEKVDINSLIYSLGIRLDNGECLPVREMNKSLFWSKSKAMKFIKRKLLIVKA